MLNFRKQLQLSAGRFNKYARNLKKEKAMANLVGKNASAECSRPRTPLRPFAALRPSFNGGAHGQEEFRHVLNQRLLGLITRSVHCPDARKTIEDCGAISDPFAHHLRLFVADVHLLGVNHALNNIKLKIRCLLLLISFRKNLPCSNSLEFCSRCVVGVHPCSPE